MLWNYHSNTQLFAFNYLKFFHHMLFKVLVLHALILFFISGFCQLPAQNFALQGTISDSITRAPLAFANIVYNQQQTGTVSSLDGNFSITSPDPIKKLTISLVGYQTKTISLTSTNTLKKLNISLKPTAYPLEEVLVYPGVNPAHRIIQEVIKNAAENDPEKLQSFSCISYNKMYFSLEDTMVGTLYPLYGIH